MNDEPLPPELTDLEGRLRNRSGGVSPVLRQRVLGAVAVELAARSEATSSRSGRWSYAAAVAAVLIVGMNLARMAPALTDFIDGELPPRPTVALAESIRQVVPELSENEARRMAVTITSGQRLVPLPLVQGRSGGMLESMGKNLLEP